VPQICELKPGRYKCADVPVAAVVVGGVRFLLDSFAIAAARPPVGPEGNFLPITAESFSSVFLLTTLTGFLDL
jgi:hypothetical protein